MTATLELLAGLEGCGVLVAAAVLGAYAIAQERDARTGHHSG